MRLPPYIPLEECKLGHVYRLQSRNLDFGVYDGRTGFIGIRTKFDSRFLDVEYHYDAPAFATACPLEDIGEVGEHIPLVTSLGSVDGHTGRPVAFHKPVADGGLGWYDVETGEPVSGARPTSVPNRELFNFLDAISDTESS